MSELSGLILVNKTSGVSSHDVVARLRKILRQKSIGHAGTLDPLAEGLMICLVGEGTKVSNYILEQDKGYRVGLKLGVETDTLDITGSPVFEGAKPVEASQVVQTALQLQGEFNWEVPMYSAKKVDGKKLYELAREGVSIEVPKKEMKFWDIEFVERQGDIYFFSLRCSKGSFIRTWVQQLGRQLGTYATMTHLTRTESMPYRLQDSISLDDLEGAVKSTGSASVKGRPYFRSLQQSLSGIKSVRIKGFSATLMKNGQISNELRSLLVSRFTPEVDQLLQVVEADADQVIALIGLEKDTGFVVKRVFRY